MVFKSVFEWRRKDEYGEDVAAVSGCGCVSCGGQLNTS